MDRNLREREFIERVAMVMDGFGLSLIAGRLLGWLLICEPAEPSSGQLAAVLGASKGSISTNTRMLLQMDLVEKVAVPGARSAYFRVRSGAWEQMMEKQRQQLTTFRVLMEDGLPLMGAAHRSVGSVWRTPVTSLHSWKWNFRRSCSTGGSGMFSVF